MHAMYRLPHLASVLLLAATPFAAAESPLPDPIAPAVIGRPLDQIKPTRPARHKPTAAKANRPKPAAAANKAVPKPATPPVAVAPPAKATAALAPPAVAQAALGAPRPPKQELDSADPQARVVDNVGQGSAVGIKPTEPGVYFGIKDETLVRRYYEAHPASGRDPKWRIGEPVPARAKMTGVPDEVRAALSPLPPGHLYVQLDNEVVLVEAQSRMVVDGVRRAVR
jgi:hypothetical protein